MTTSTHNAVSIRPGHARGRTQIGWLNSRHSFSFGQYHDASRMNYGALRVINDDRILPGAGFGEHGHDNMEILTWVLEGSLRHGDSLANSRLLSPGELQAMSAGSGIRHSEFNGSDTEPARFLQIWIQPAEQNTAPRYDQRTFDAEGRRNGWQVLASGDSALAANALPIGQDVTLRVADLGSQQQAAVTVQEGRRAYVHVATGSVVVGGQRLEDGDALTVEAESEVVITAEDQAQVLWFDLV